MSPPETPHSENVGRIPEVSNLELEEIWKESQILPRPKYDRGCLAFIDGRQGDADRQSPQGELNQRRLDVTTIPASYL
jgi:hypothetical protein